MPLTYHFKPFPQAGEPHFETQDQHTTRPGLTATPCACRKQTTPCNRCRQVDRDAWRRPSQAMLSPIKEDSDPSRRQLTPKAIRDKRRASSRMSVAAAFTSAVGTEDYFPLYHSRSFTRSNSSSSESSRSRSSRRHGSGSSSTSSRSSSSDQDQSPPSEAAQVSAFEHRKEPSDNEKVAEES